MKRILLFSLLLLIPLLSLFGCTQTTKIEDLSRTSYIEIHAFSPTDQSYTDYVISDFAVVDEICALLNTLTLEKVRITKPLHIDYTLIFYDHAHRQIDELIIVSENYVNYNGDLHKIADNCDLADFLASILATQAPQNSGE